METIATNRLIIRNFKPTDWQDLFEYFSDEEVLRYEPYEVFSEKQAKEEAERRSHLDTFLAVSLQTSGKVIGNLYLAKGDFDTWELGYVFNRFYQGQGYATESAKALLDYTFTHLGARRIAAMCNPLNERSWRLLERLNMRREGHLLQNIYFKTDAEGTPIWQDTYEYAILRTEWSTRACLQTL
ncbi:GNAT family N-acetyltransferase [Gorillibacterium timonense]|uniref:GNAT family N-acetyltransferase n=1 Tax=Gorillibacterium timonense TaxID=1689269 RepID=UPI00071E35F7|nr:GNAT family N-acetyltransferase [Gorillibacterium timonense]